MVPMLPHKRSHKKRIVTQKDVGKPVLVWWLDINERKFFDPSILLDVSEAISCKVFSIKDRQVNSISEDQILDVGVNHIEIHDFDHAEITDPKY